MMAPERWERVAEIYHAALSRPPDDRATFVHQSAAGDDALRQEVDSLLAQEQAQLLLDQPLDTAAAAAFSDDVDLTPDTFVGSYRVVSLLGEGGMGQVYRSYDTKLQREVALKILPDTFGDDPDRRARFTREAQLLASLNHPNIGTIYGFEDSGDIHALVLELVDGPTLADRISTGFVTLDEALSIARQIAEALEAAHEHGIIHRDLKPSNIKVRDDGTVKVLDFGLAKLSREGTTAADASAPGHNMLATASPTALHPTATAVGAVLGTAAYMSPEQARGRIAGKRSDVWAFGCVLYEMLTSRKAFEGEDVNDTIAAVLRNEPDWSALPASLPPAVRKILEGCLEKDPRKRIADISIPLYLLRESASTEPAVEKRWPTRHRRRLFAVGAVVIAAVSAGITWRVVRGQLDGDTASVTRLEVPLGGGAGFTFSGRHLVAISPDGRWIAYPADNRLYLRHLGSLDAISVRLSGSGVGAREPFFSPDGQWLGFWHEGALRKVRVAGGAPEEIAKADNPTGVNWEANGDIVFGQGRQGIFRVSSNGGSPTRIVTLESQEVAHGPQLLPGDRILFTLLNGADLLWSDAQIVVQSLRTRERHVVFRGATDARFLSSNHLLYVTNGTLVAAPFDLSTLTIGAPEVTVPDVAETSNNASGAAHYALSANGTLAYVRGMFLAVPRSLLAWVDRQGRESVIAIEPGPYVQPRVSPDGKRIAVAMREREQNLALIDLEPAGLDLLTNLRGRATSPVWRGAGEILFGLARAGNVDLWSQIVPRTGPPRQLTNASYGEIPASLSSDGRTVVILDPDQSEIRILSLGDEPSVRSIDGKGLRNPEISPDGRCLAYNANNEVFVRALEGDGRPEQISTEGGLQPTWAMDGTELFYVSAAGGLVRARAHTQPSCAVETARPFINGPYLWFIPTFEGIRFYHITPDGQRFLVLKPVSEQPPTPRSIVVVQNWFQDWKRPPRR